MTAPLGGNRPAAGDGLSVRRRSSGRADSGPGEAVAMFIDTTTCIGCKACEVACQEWNGLPLEPTVQFGTYQTLPALTANYWNLIKFDEIEEGGIIEWLMRKDMCLHCAEPGCLLACPVPGAIFQYQNGVVEIDPETCIGCGFCITGCPFEVPKLHPATGKAHKCTMCSDRLEHGLGPACVKACPTGCLQFGSKTAMLDLGGRRVEAPAVKFPGKITGQFRDPLQELSLRLGTSAAVPRHRRILRYLGILDTPPRRGPHGGMSKTPPPTTRREFLRLAAAAPLTLAAGAAGLSAAERRVPVVDAHLHCFAGPDDPRFPYHPQGPYRPAKPATPERLLECMDGAGIDFAVVVHPEPYQDDHRYLEHCLAAGKGRLKGTCLFFAERPGSIGSMRELVKKLGAGKIVAARIHAYAPERLPPFGKPELKEFWKAAGELGLAVQLHFEPRHASGFEPLIAEFPRIPVIVDHLGRPFQGTPEEHAVVLRWSRFPNVHLKLSAIPSKHQYPHRDIAPVIRRAVEAFGPDRMLYGGGFDAEATAESYRAAREAARAHLVHLPDGAQAAVLGGTAARLFGF